MKQEAYKEDIKSGQPYGPLTSRRAQQLVERLLPHDDSDQAAALMELVTGIASDEDHAHREDVAHFAMQHAFSLCMAFDGAADDFYKRTCGALKVEDTPAPEAKATARKARAKDAGKS